LRPCRKYTYPNHFKTPLWHEPWLDRRKPEEIAGRSFFASLKMKELEVYTCMTMFGSEIGFGAKIFTSDHLPQFVEH
jgi:hypothetical protein